MPRRKSTSHGKKPLLFQSCPKRTSPRLFKLRTTLEAWMLANQGKQVPRKKFMREFKASETVVGKIILQIEKHHELPSRGHGGPRPRLPATPYKIIERFHREAKPGSTIQILDIARAIAKRTGKVIAPGSIRNKLKALDKSQKKPEATKVGWAGLPSSGQTVERLRKLLEKEGIKAERATREYHIWR